MKIDEFLRKEGPNLMQLLHDTYQFYGRRPARILVGPQVEPWPGDVKFMELPVTRDMTMEHGEVFALMNDSNLLDHARARRSRRPMITRSNMRLVK